MALGTECKGCFFLKQEWTKMEQIKEEQNNLQWNGLAWTSTASKFRQISTLNAPCVQPRHCFCPWISVFWGNSSSFNMWHMGSSLEKSCILGQASIKAAVETNPVEKYQLRSSPTRGHQVIKHMFILFPGMTETGETHSLLGRNVRSSPLSRGKVPSMKHSHRGKWFKSTTKRSGAYLYTIVYSYFFSASPDEGTLVMGMLLCINWKSNVVSPFHRPKMGISLSLQAWFSSFPCAHKPPLSHRHT